MSVKRKVTVPEGGPKLSLNGRTSSVIASLSSRRPIIPVSSVTDG